MSQSTKRPPEGVPPLAKADTVALWHAVEAFALQVRCMEKMEGFTEEERAAEAERVTAAKRALRKVNAMRRAAKP